MTHVVCCSWLSHVYLCGVSAIFSILNQSKLQDAQQVLRYIDSEPAPALRWRDQRAFLLAEHAEFVPHSSSAFGSASAFGASASASAASASASAAATEPRGTLKLSGYLRGTKALTANHLVHITGFADFQLDAIEARASAAEAAAARLRGRAGRDAKANAMNEVAVWLEKCPHLLAHAVSCTDKHVYAFELCIPLCLCAIHVAVFSCIAPFSFCHLRRLVPRPRPLCRCVSSAAPPPRASRSTVCSPPTRTR